MNTANLIQKAHDAAEAVTIYYCSAAGKPINTTEEFSVLVEWHDAIQAAKSYALQIRSWVDVSDLEKMHDECNMWLDHCMEVA